MAEKKKIIDLTEDEQKIVDDNLTKKDQAEIKRIVDEMQAVFLLTKQEGELYRRWMHDSERFMGFTFSHTKALVKHSITLTRLSYALGFIALAQIVVIILVAVGIIG